ncbi:MAG TPA: riboflavin kinase [Candidatus Paceibacterota bacterium]
MNYQISGKVIKGDGYGKKLGFPTVNLEIKDSGVKITEGVYAGKAFLEKKEYTAGIVVGPGGKVEAHLLGYDGDAYGKKVRLEINKFLREYKKFKTEEELIKQIVEDLKAC